MIDRYTRPGMGALWTDHARMEAWRKVEVAACEEMDGPGEADLEAIRAATFTVHDVQERERITDHDVAAFVDVLAESAGEPGRWIHFGLTSSDVLDTALAVQMKIAGEDIILPGAQELVDALAAQARAHVDTVCVGRTHGIHAEPTTFGIKLAGFAMEAARNRDRLRRAVLALPEELRSVVTAHYWGEIPVAEIAKQEGMTPPGVRKRLARAFAAIQAALEVK